MLLHMGRAYRQEPALPSANLDVMDLPRGLVTSVIVTLLLAPGAAQAQEPDASRPPRASGPLVSLSQGCEDDGPPESGSFSVQSCWWTYDLVPAESDIDEDFMVHWQQMELQTTGRTCARAIHFQLTIPAGYRIVSTAPAVGRARVRDGQALVALEVDGDGAAPIAGAIEQDVLYGPGRITVNTTGRRFVGKWHGNHRGKVMVAFGVQIARPAVGDLIASWSLYEGWEIGTCGPRNVTT
jgi:hypothetical protein